MASKHYDFELHANLFNGIKVDENFCLHSVGRYLNNGCIIIYLHVQGTCSDVNKILISTIIIYIHVQGTYSDVNMILMSTSSWPYI